MYFYKTYLLCKHVDLLAVEWDLSFKLTIQKTSSVFVLIFWLGMFPFALCFLQVLSGRGRMILSQAACYPSLAALRVGRTRTFSAASSDEPYTHATPTESGIMIQIELSAFLDNDNIIIFIHFLFCCL